MAKALCDYIFHVEHNPKKAVELCAAATQVSKFKDWCWKARLGKVKGRYFIPINNIFR